MAPWRTPQTVRQIGTILGEQAQAEGLARYAEATLSDVARRIAAAPPRSGRGSTMAVAPKAWKRGLRDRSTWRSSTSLVHRT